jgi:hypothetical protein
MPWADPPARVAPGPDGLPSYVLRFQTRAGAVREEAIEQPLLMLSTLADTRLAPAHAILEAGAGPGLERFLAAQRARLDRGHDARLTLIREAVAKRGGARLQAYYRKDYMDGEQAVMFAYADSLIALGDGAAALATIDAWIASPAFSRTPRWSRQEAIAKRAFILELLRRHDEAVDVARTLQRTEPNENTRYYLAARLFGADRPAEALEQIDAMGNWVKAKWATSRPAPGVNPEGVMLVTSLRACAFKAAGRDVQAREAAERVYGGLEAAPARYFASPPTSRSRALWTAVCMGDPPRVAQYWLAIVGRSQHSPCALLFQPAVMERQGPIGQRTLEEAKARPDVAAVYGATQRDLTRDLDPLLHAQTTICDEA